MHQIEVTLLDVVEIAFPKSSTVAYFLTAQYFACKYVIGSGIIDYKSINVLNLFLVA